MFRLFCEAFVTAPAATYIYLLCRMWPGATDSPTFHHQNHRECETVTWNSFSKCLVSRHIFIRDSKSRWMDRNSGNSASYPISPPAYKFEENKAYGISLGYVSTARLFPPFQHRCLTTRVKPFQKKMASDIHLNNAQRIRVQSLRET